MKRRIIYLALCFLFVFFILRNFNNGEKLVRLLGNARWEFIILALLLQASHYLLSSSLYKKILRLYGASWKLKEIVPLVFASLSINIFAPLAPFPGSGIFLQKARRENIPALNIAATVFLVILFDYLALCPFLAVSLFLQIVNNSLFKYEILGLVVFMVLIFFLFLILVFGILSPKIISFLFSVLENIINTVHFLFKKRDFFIKGWSSSRTLQFIALSEKLMTQNSRKRELFAIAFAKHAVDLGTLYILFLAFGSLVSLPTIFIGYSLMMLFWVVTPTPQGVGFVEVIAPAIFSSMGINIETSTLAVLAYRGLNLWIPVIIGFVFMHNIFENKTFKKE